MTVIPWRRSRAEEQARAMHPSAGSKRNRASVPVPSTTRAAPWPGRRPQDSGAPQLDVDGVPLGSVVRVCSAARCRRFLRGSAEGRLSYLTGRGPVTLVVPYLVADLDSLLIPVAPFNEARQYVPGRTVTLEVRGTSAEFTQWVVRVSGTATETVVDADLWSGRAALDPPPGSAPVPALDSGEMAALELPLRQLRGFGVVAPRPVGTAQPGS